MLFLELLGAPLSIVRLRVDEPILNAEGLLWCRPCLTSQACLSACNDITGMFGLT